MIPRRLPAFLLYLLLSSYSFSARVQENTRERKSQQEEAVISIETDPSHYLHYQHRDHQKYNADESGRSLGFSLSKFWVTNSKQGEEKEEGVEISSGNTHEDGNKMFFFERFKNRITSSFEAISRSSDNIMDNDNSKVKDRSDRNHNKDGVSDKADNENDNRRSRSIRGIENDRIDTRQRSLLGGNSLDSRGSKGRKGGSANGRIGSGSNGRGDMSGLRGKLSSRAKEDRKSIPKEEVIPDPQNSFKKGPSTECFALLPADVTLFIPPDHAHSKECFPPAPLSFETCRQMLALTPSCQALTYRGGMCALHVNLINSSNFPFVLRLDAGPLRPLIYVRKKLTGKACLHSPSSNGQQSWRFRTAAQKFRECTKHLNHRNPHHRTADISSLPLLGIVISVTESWAQRHQEELSSVVSNFQCYASAHPRYTFIVNKLPDMPVAQFFHERHRSVLHQYLPHYQYILHLDADSLVLNISASLDRFLAPNSADVKLHLHENGEITASTYLIRNSEYSRCFLQYWNDFSPPRGDIFKNLTSPGPYLESQSYDPRNYEVPNFDNGDLVFAMLNLLGPKHYLKCMHTVATLPEEVKSGLANNYHQTVIECLKPLLSQIQARLEQSTRGRVKVYLPKEGYWRTHSRHGRFSSLPTHWWNELTASCYSSSDVIGHGWKAMASKMWPSAAFPNTMCNTSLAPPHSGGNPHCKWHSASRELDMAMRYCNWRSPVCMRRDPSVCGRVSEVSRRLLRDLFSQVDDQICNVCVLDPLARCSGYKNRPAINVSSEHFEEEMVHAMNSSKFGVESEEWWEQQLCASCPHYDVR